MPKIKKTENTNYCQELKAIWALYIFGRSVKLYNYSGNLYTYDHTQQFHT
jgi:hypothetical protein